MSSVMNPIGPEEPSTYWRRRLLVGLGALVVLIIFFLLLRSCSSDPAPTAAPAPTTSTVTSPEPTTSSSAGADGLCTDSDIEVTIQPNNGTTFPTGTPVTFTMSIKNISTKACQRNVGTKPNTVLIESGGQQIWSSDDCAPPGQDDIKTIEPGDIFQLNATWDQKQSQTGCPAGQPTAPAASYEAVGMNDQVKSAPAPFTIS